MHREQHILPHWSQPVQPASRGHLNVFAAMAALVDACLSTPMPNPIGIVALFTTLSRDVTSADYPAASFDDRVEENKEVAANHDVASLAQPLMSRHEGSSHHLAHI